MIILTQETWQGATKQQFVGNPDNGVLAGHLDPECPLLGSSTLLHAQSGWLCAVACLVSHLFIKSCAPDARMPCQTLTMCYMCSLSMHIMCLVCSCSPITNMRHLWCIVILPVVGEISCDWSRAMRSDLLQFGMLHLSCRYCSTAHSVSL